MSFLSVILSDVNQEKSGAGLLFLFVIKYYYYYNYYHLCFYGSLSQTIFIKWFVIFTFMLYQSAQDLVTHLNVMCDML